MLAITTLLLPRSSFQPEKTLDTQNPKLRFPIRKVQEPGIFVRFATILAVAVVSLSPKPFYLQFIVRRRTYDDRHAKF